MKKRRLLSIVLSLCMVLALIPQMVFAEGTDIPDEVRDKLEDGDFTGTVELENDYTINEMLRVARCTLDLNGHVINTTGSDRVLFIDDDATLMDSSEGKPGGITGGTPGVLIPDNARLTMKGGTIYDCSGGVKLGFDSWFTMEGGEISDCTSYAVNAESGCIIFANGGIIRGDVVSRGEILTTAEGGGCTEFYGKVTNGGTIKGGIYYGDVVNNATIEGGTFYGTVENDYRTIKGGTFYGTITGNGDVSGVTYRRIVTFDSNGGSAVSSQDIVKDSSATEPTAPTKEGYNFTGWYLDEELKTPYDFEAKLKII